MVRTAICLLAILTLSVPALAVDPTPGDYTSVDVPFGSMDVLTGRGSNARPVPDNGIDNVYNSMSWNGATLGTQWTFQCGVSTSQNVVDNTINGTGTIVFTTVYQGGNFWLSKDGPWGDGTVDFTGLPGLLTRITTLQMVDGQPVGAVENVNVSGEFDNSNCALLFVINNNLGVGDTDVNPPLPADYPPFLDPNCGATGVSGSWGDVHDIQLRIECPLPTEESTWGAIKSMYE